MTKLQFSKYYKSGAPKILLNTERNIMAELRSDGGNGSGRAEMKQIAIDHVATVPNEMRQRATEKR